MPASGTSRASKKKFHSAHIIRVYREVIGSVLQCVAQCVAVCCSVLQCVAEAYPDLPRRELILQISFVRVYVWEGKVEV